MRSRQIRYLTIDEIAILQQFHKESSSLIFRLDFLKNQQLHKGGGGHSHLFSISVGEEECYVFRKRAGQDGLYLLENDPDKIRSLNSLPRGKSRVRVQSRARTIKHGSQSSKSHSRKA